MTTIEDRIKQAQVEINNAIAKRIRAQKLWNEADEELMIARIKMEDALKHEKRPKQVRKPENEGV